jgi:hypothetical protein
VLNLETIRDKAVLGPPDGVWDLSATRLDVVLTPR